MSQSQVWSTNTDGGFLYNDELSSQLRTEAAPSAKFRQFCKPDDMTDKGLHRGDTVHWDIAFALENDTDITLNEGTAIPESKFVIRQGTATVEEYGRSIPFTEKLRAYGFHDIAKVCKKQLTRHCHETLDKKAEVQFRATALKYVGTATDGGVLTTNGTATATNTSGLNKSHVRTIVDTLKERNVAPFYDDCYAAVARPTTLRPLEDDLESVHRYQPEGYEKILYGQVGKFAGCYFAEQTNVNSGVSRNGTAWSGGLSDWAYFTGEDNVAEIVVMPPEIRAALPGDYGRQHGLAWLGHLVHAAIYNTTNDPDAINASVIEWSSNA